MRKRERSDADSPECPNNSRHGLRPDVRGGYVCETCVEELAGTRSRLPTRWAFAHATEVVDTAADTE
jgi:hypothetical protein